MQEERRVGREVPNWSPPVWPDTQCLEGQYVRLERLNATDHAAELHAANRGSDWIWDYLPYGPFESVADYRAWAETMAGERDPFFYAIRDLAGGRLGGVASFLRITPQQGVIEVGHICFAPALQGTRAATEAMTLLARWVFGAGYRRYEWKCDALNLPSRRAAERLGFSYEGTFRQHTIYKGRNRDTAWFAMTDGDWKAIGPAYDRWLAPENFDPDGQQRESLSALTRPHLVTRDPGPAAG
ncbi:MAG TPA: GNAT family protein [Paracoccaceae bacterium]|mgnify:CR=1 FL=1|nr:GNAT family protein [Paracoccaceae bacterium]